MSSRAIYSFLGFPETPVRHLTLQHDGFPTGAAWRFAVAARSAADPSAFLASFVLSQPAAEALACPERGGDAEYRYHVQLRGRRSRHLLVQCWRRYPEGIGWQRRCGPMRLECFLRRFPPGS